MSGRCCRWWSAWSLVVGLFPMPSQENTGVPALRMPFEGDSPGEGAWAHSSKHKPSLGNAHKPLTFRARPSAPAASSLAVHAAVPRCAPPSRLLASSRALGFLVGASRGEAPPISRPWRMAGGRAPAHRDGGECKRADQRSERHSAGLAHGSRARRHGYWICGVR